MVLPLPQHTDLDYEDRVERQEELREAAARERQAPTAPRRSLAQRLRDFLARIRRR